MPHGSRLRRVFANVLLCVAIIGVLVLAGCTDEQFDIPQREVQGGDSARGQTVLADYGCPACHVIPGVQNAEAHVGPPLTNWARRAYIAGSLPNMPESLVTWVQVPQSVEPGTAMPDMGVTDEAARDIAAYLYTIR